MQTDAVGSLTNGVWQLALPDGVYTVEASVGDNDYFDSVHSVEANGVDLISEFVPTSNGDFETGSADFEVTDGLLTVEPGFNGSNTKINWIRVVGEDCEGDCFPPTVNIDVDGPRDFETGDLANEATVTIEASDLGGSGVDSLTYTLNGGASQDYDEPFTARIGLANMDATRVDDAPAPGFWDDWLTMHRINGGLYQGMQYQAEATLEIRNTGRTTT